MNDWDFKSYIMTSAVHSCTNTEGIVCGHAYTLLGAGKNADSEHMIHVRNPWAREKYTGEWSDTASPNKWTDAHRAALNHVKADDGSYWLPVATFRRIFSSVVTAYYQGWHKTYKADSWDRVVSIRSKTTKFHNSEVQNVCVGMSGTSNRQFLDNSFAASDRLESVAFSLRNSSSRYFASENGATYGWAQGYDGAGWLCFNDLPVGDYEFYPRQSSTRAIGVSGNIFLISNELWGFNLC